MTKLFVSDFDDTLFKNHNKEFKVNIETINNFVANGNIFVIATGRHINNLLRDIKQYKINYSYLICNDGGIIFDNELNIIFQKNIKITTAREIIKLFKKGNCLNDWYIDCGTFITKDLKHPVNGIIGKINNQSQASNLLTTITNQFKDTHGYVTTNWICITNHNVSKLAAIKFINNLLKIKDKNIYTIGDNINDISMSKYNSYCMVNSHPSLKKVCQGEYESVNKLIKYINNKRKEESNEKEN